MQLHLGATEIGQGADTVFYPDGGAGHRHSHRRTYISVSFQDTDTAPFDTGAYASRQTYVTARPSKRPARSSGEAPRLRRRAVPRRIGAWTSGSGRSWTACTGEALISLADLAMTAFYSLEQASISTAEDTSHCKENTFAFGCCFAEVEVDIPVGKVRVLRIVNVHDSGKLINPALAEAQVHGGMSMGIGYALTEEMSLDPKTGRLLNGNLLDYKMPTVHGSPRPHRPVRGDRPTPPAPSATRLWASRPPSPWPRPSATRCSRPPAWR